jgi:hypothetical protein
MSTGTSSISDRILREEIKLYFIGSKVLRTTLYDLSKNNTLINLREDAKRNKNKQFKDLSKLASDYIRTLDGLNAKMKEFTSPGTWSMIISDLNLDYVSNIHVIMEKVSHLPDDIVENDLIPYIDKLLKDKK